MPWDLLSQHAGHGHDESSLSSTFPLPLRILSFCSVGALAFASNVHILSIVGIDACVLLDVRLPTGAHIHPSSFCRMLYQVARTSGVLTFLGYLGWRICLLYVIQQNQEYLITYLSTFYMIGCLIALAYMFSVQRLQAKRSLSRIALDTLSSPPPFCDIVFADILTSFARVIGDFVVVCASLFVQEPSKWLPAIVSAVPYIFRLRQCLAEVYSSSGDEPGRGTGDVNDTNTTILFDQEHEHIQLDKPSSKATSSNDRNLNNYISDSRQQQSRTAPIPSDPRRRSMMNAIKYATALPVIFLGAMQPSDPYHDEKQRDSFNTGLIFHLWVVSVLVNSMYSFWWDVTNDWGFSLLLLPLTSQKKQDQEQAPGQQQRKTFSKQHARQATASTLALEEMTSPRRRAQSIHHSQHEPPSSVNTQNQQQQSSSSSIPSSQQQQQQQQQQKKNPTVTIPSPKSTQSTNLALPPVSPSSSSSSPENTTTSLPAQNNDPHNHDRHHRPGRRRPLWKRLLRDRTILVSSGWLYFAIIVINLMLRLTWSLKLSPRFHGLTSDKHQGGGFSVEIAEVLRRWIWVFVRIEWEYIRLGHA